MASFQLKSFFRMEEATWTETAYWVGPSYSGAISVLQTVLAARLQLLGFPAFCTGSRVSAIGHPGNSTSGAPPLFTPTLQACEPWTGLRVRFDGSGAAAATGAFKVELLRAVPVTWLPTEGQGSALKTPAGQLAFRTWVAALVSNQVCIQARTGQSPLYPVLGVAWWATVDSDTIGTPLDAQLNDPGTTFVSLGLGGSILAPNSLPDIIPGSDVGIHGVSFVGSASARAPDLNGSRVAVDAIPGMITVVAEPPSEGQWVASGTVQVEELAFLQIRTATPQGPGEKKVGSTKYAHLGRSFPAGYIPAPPEPPPPPPPEPPVYGVDETSPPYPGAIVVRNAQELCAVCYQGYPDVEPFTTLPVTLYQIVNYTNAYYMCCSGTDSLVNPTTGIPADITVGLGLPFGIPLAIIDLIDRFVPPDAVLFMAGHSLGGMGCECAIDYGAGKPGFLLKVVTFGSPVVGFLRAIKGAILKVVLKSLNLGSKFRRFATKGDIVPALTPVGFLSYTLLSSPELTIVSNSPYGSGPYESHVHYQELKSLQAWDVFGNPGPNQPPTPGETIYLDLVATVFPGILGERKRRWSQTGLK